MSAWASSTVAASLTADEARHLTDLIVAKLNQLVPLVKRAYEGRADKALGYPSWHAYCAAELGGLRLPLADRPAAVAELRDAGMSTRAIGSALGVDAKTVRNDLAATGEQSPVEKVISLDGRERPATMPAKADIEPDRLWMSIRRKGLNHHLIPAGSDKTACDRWVGGDGKGRFDNGVLVGPENVAELESKRCPQCWPEIATLPAGQSVGDRIVDSIEKTAKETAPSTSSGQDLPPAPPTPEQREQVYAARHTAKVITKSFVGQITTIIAGSRAGASDVITPELIAELRLAIDVLEAELLDRELEAAR